MKEWIQSIAKTQDSDCSGTKTTPTTINPSTGIPNLNKTIELLGGSNRKEGTVYLHGKAVW